MYKLFISLTGTGFVLLTGLVSCSQEKKTPDVYNTKPPILRTGSGSQDIQAWSTLATRQLDLYDTWDFSESPASRVFIRTECYEGSSNHLSGEGTFASAAQVKVWQVLPTKLLTADLNKQKYMCGFELNLFNENGSRHIYPVTPTQIVEQAIAPAQIGLDGGQLPNPIFPTKLANVHLRYANADRAAAKLVCQDIELSSLPFEQVLDISHFDFAHPVPRDNSKANSWQANPTQSCRALITEAGVSRAISNRIHLQMPLPELGVEVVPVSLNNGSRDANQELITNIRLARVNPVVGSWRVRNPSSAKRFLKLPKGPVAHEILIHFIGTATSGEFVKGKAAISTASTLLELVGKPTLINESEQARTVALSAGESLSVQARFTVRTPYNCGPIDGMRFQKFAPFLIEEVTSDGSPVGNLRLTTPDQNLLLDTAVDFSSGAEWQGCSTWR